MGHVVERHPLVAALAVALSPLAIAAWALLCMLAWS